MSSTDTQNLIDLYKIKGATKGEIYLFFNHFNDKEVRAEMLDILMESRGIDLVKARNQRVLKGSEVEKLVERLR